LKKEDALFSHLPIPVPINIGKIYGGQWASSVADHVILEGRVRIQTLNIDGNCSF
jgi:acetylornithine deacetylase